ncbi:MAG: hypothetical protein HY700_15765 [Gemmatimonadetes bacterium]|nr:hypothetical protein [Gemmatimonadota bacterium]
MKTWLGLAIVASVGLAPGWLTAQETAAGRVLRGIIVDSVSQRPVGGAVMYFEGRRDEFYSGSEGQFHIPGVGFRDTVMVVRRIGYVPLRVAVPRTDSPLAVDLGELALRPVATKLDRIAVEAEEVSRFPQLSEFYRRKQRATGGVFITREDIERSAARQTSEMLRRVVKIELDCINDRVGADNCIARNRRGRIIRPNRVSSGTRRGNVIIPEDTATLDLAADRCEMTIYVDGMRSSLRVDEVPLSWIGGIEVYSGLATTPPGFGNATCGVIAIWTTTAIRG